MNSYSRGVIYFIQDIDSEQIYIGCTRQGIRIRISEHKHEYKDYMRGKRRYQTSFGDN